MIAAPLIDIHGQSHHLSLMNPRQHVDLLDRFANTLPLRTQFAQLVTALRKIRQEMQTLASSGRELALRAERAKYIVEEIGEAKLEPNEEEELNQERKVLVNAEKLAKLAEVGYVRLSEGFGDQMPSILILLSEVADAVSELAQLDNAMQETEEIMWRLYHYVGASTKEILDLEVVLVSNV